MLSILHNDFKVQIIHFPYKPLNVWLPIQCNFVVKLKELFDKIKKNTIYTISRGIWSYAVIEQLII